VTSTYLLLLIVLTSAMSAVTAARSKAVSWVVVNAVFVVAGGAGYLLAPERAGVWLIGPYLGFVIVPLIAFTQVHRLLAVKRGGLARAVARIAFVLHPSRGNRRLVRMTEAYLLAAAGKVDEAATILRDAGHEQDLELEMMRLHNKWPEIIAYIEAASPKPVEHSAAVLYMRALGETGDLGRLIDAYFDALELWANRDDMADEIATVRMFVTAFLGRPALVEQLHAGPLRRFPASVKQYWIAIAHAAGGDRERAATTFAELQHDPEERMRSAAAFRATNPPARVEELGPAVRTLLATIEQEVRDTAAYAGHHAHATRPVISYVIVASLVVVHGFVVWKPGAIHDLGVFWSPWVLERGEWWRVVSAVFLHAGWMHLAMNIFGLLWFGPFVERFLGRLRFALVYLAGGIGGFAVLAGLDALGWREPTAALGASGAVMAMIGASIGIFLRGSSRSPVAAKRLRDMLSFVALQVVFDILAPRVSMTAHVAGLAIGVSIGLLTKRAMTTDRP
jgi:rhomboid protease GluP